VTHPESEVVCDLFAARVTAEQDSLVINRASVRVQCSDLTFVENLDTPHIRSSVWFPTCMSHCQERLGGAHQFVFQGLSH